ncbi:hypothetical protein PAAG_05371 [Paracoccidioides lutzii Pb01]|uniref:Uncharacterized protein n=1 Tax=Paracoccidioides lutzii (strain ATCC MYA-826 / Pb01) TaxID=502779 RepID=C1H3M8_PARBA|nr:hypothetical protein PAAG_05371 [Paracoccidioides lutzii Pb01]EEH34322.2 hypothetical protein PAAG_05371 [Paracoccidioides lutzii Pb01]
MLISKEFVCGQEDAGSALNCPRDMQTRKRRREGAILDRKKPCFAGGRSNTRGFLTRSENNCHNCQSPTHGGVFSRSLKVDRPVLATSAKLQLTRNSQRQKAFQDQIYHCQPREAENCGVFQTTSFYVANNLSNPWGKVSGDVLPSEKPIGFGPCGNWDGPNAGTGWDGSRKAKSNESPERMKIDVGRSGSSVRSISTSKFITGEISRWIPQKRSQETPGKTVFPQLVTNTMKSQDLVGCSAFKKVDTGSQILAPKNVTPSSLWRSSMPTQPFGFDCGKAGTYHHNFDHCRAKRKRKKG